MKKQRATAFNEEARAAMPLRLSCPSCARALTVPDEKAGLDGVCPSCGIIFPIPAPPVSSPERLHSSTAVTATSAGRSAGALPPQRAAARPTPPLTLPRRATGIALALGVLAFIVCFAAAWMGARWLTDAFRRPAPPPFPATVIAPVRPPLSPEKAPPAPPRDDPKPAAPKPPLLQLDAPDAIHLNPGESNTQVLGFRRINFEGPVRLTFDGAPSDLVCPHLEDLPADQDSVRITISAPVGAKPGRHELTAKIFSPMNEASDFQPFIVLVAARPAPPPPPPAPPLPPTVEPLSKDAVVVHIQAKPSAAPNPAARRPVVVDASAPPPKEERPGGLLFLLRGHGTGSVNWVAFSPDSSKLVSGGDDGRLVVWDAAVGRSIAAFPNGDTPVQSVTFSPDGKSLLAASGQAGTGRPAPPTLRDADSGKVVRQFSAGPPAVRRAVFTPDGKYVLTVGEGDCARLYDAGTGENVATFYTAGSPMYTAAAGGAALLAAGRDGVVRLWDVSGRERKRFQGDSMKPLFAAAVTADGERILFGGEDGVMRFWDLKEGKELQAVAAHPFAVHRVALTPDGRFAASTGALDAAIRVWDLNTGEEVYRYEKVGRAVQCVAFSPDGRRIAAASLDGTVRIWAAPDVVKPEADPAR